jgi:hypothetical protein
MDLAKLEQRLTRVEDIEAIKQLKARYCEICDDDHNPDRIATIFAEDAVWDAEGIGKAEGHVAIRALFQTFQQQIDFSQHMVMNPIIQIDGERATGIWYFAGPFTPRQDPQSNLTAVRYEEDYVKVNGEWKFQHPRAAPRFVAAVEKIG